MAVVPGDLPPPLDVAPAAQFWIDMATSEVDEQLWLCRGFSPDLGIIALASHYLTQSPSGGGAIVGGLAVSETRKNKSITVQPAGAASGAHGSTSFGQTYDGMLGSVMAKRRRHLPPPPQPSC